MRLAELIAMISLGTDLGMGQPMEHVMRQSLIALRLAERLGLDETTRAVVYYVGLIALGRVSRRRVRAGEVVRRRHGAQGRRPPRGHDRLAREGVRRDATSAPAGDWRSALAWA